MAGGRAAASCFLLPSRRRAALIFAVVSFHPGTGLSWGGWDQEGRAEISATDGWCRDEESVSPLPTTAPARWSVCRVSELKVKPNNVGKELISIDASPLPGSKSPLGQQSVCRSAEMASFPPYPGPLCVAADFTRCPHVARNLILSHHLPMFTVSRQESHYMFLELATATRS